MLEKEELQRRIRGWLGDYGLIDDLSEVVVPAAAWTRFCSPAGLTADVYTLAGVDLSLWLFSVDDYRGQDVDDYLDRCLDVLDGRAVTGESNIVVARRRLLDQVSERGAIDRYLTSRKDYIDAIRRRNGLIAQRKRLKFQEYLELRKTTISMGQWVALWAILESSQVEMQFNVRTQVSEAIDAIACCHIFQNEPQSLERDIKSGTPNLVLLLSEERGCSVQQAVGMLRTMRLEAATAYDACVASLRHFRGLGVLNACRFGGDAASESSGGRYQNA